MFHTWKKFVQDKHAAKQNALRVLLRLNNADLSWGFSRWRLVFRDSLLRDQAKQCVHCRRFVLCCFPC